MVLESILTMKYNARIQIVNNGQEALDAVIGNKENEEDWFDLILMDCNMPIMDGFEASRAIK